MGEFIVPSPDVPSIPEAPKTPKQKGVLLTTNPGLVKICKIITSAESDITNLKDIAIAQNFSRSNDRHYLKGLFGELHVQDVLQQFSRELNYRLNLSPVETGTQTENYTFKTNPQGKISAISNHNGQKFVEYGALIQIDDLPVVIVARQVGPNRPEHLKAILSEKRIVQLFTPLQEHFDTDQFGYVVVTDQSSINPHSSNQQAFQERGGIIIPSFFPDLVHSGIIFDNKDEA